MADIRRREIEDWARRERFARAAQAGAPASTHLLTRLLARLSTFTLQPTKPTKPAKKRTRKMQKAMPFVR